MRCIDITGNLCHIGNIMLKNNINFFYANQLLVPIFAAYNNLALFRNSNGIYILQLYQSDNNYKTTFGTANF